VDEPALVPDPEPGVVVPDSEGSAGRLSLRTRLTATLIGVAVIPVILFGGIVVLIGRAVLDPGTDANVDRLLMFALLFTMAVIVILTIVMSYLLAEDLMAPLRSIAASVDRARSGDLSTPIRVAGEDELARLAESHNRLAADLLRRNRELANILTAIGTVQPRDGAETIVERAAGHAKSAFEMIDAVIVLGDPSDIPEEEVVPGETRTLRAPLRVGTDELGILLGRLPATRRWERADQDLLDLFASEIAVGVRNAQLFEQVEAQNTQLLELDAAKDDFLRGVSHNLQTPLTSIRAYADQLDEDRPDRRLGIISEQSERLSRMVRQLLTVSRLESGALRPKADVLSLATRVRKAWEALGTDGVTFDLIDDARGWLAVADADQLDQVLWALLDNAVKYGGTSVAATIAVEVEASTLHLTISDRGPGIAEADRDQLFGRFVRGADNRPDEGSGLGLYVSRELCRAMAGDLRLEPARPDGGAAFTIDLPGEAPDQ
jgi:K+-sensing histidine kinase KdpD